MHGTIRKTPLHDWHKANGAKLVDFGGWDMPLWYTSGAVAEHLRVVTQSGLFDTSHMAMVTVGAAGAFDLLQHCFSKDLASLKAGRCAYGVFLNQEGGVIDDAIVYRVGPDDLLVVVNAGMGPVIAAHLDAHRARPETRISDLTALLGKMDLQGPAAFRIAEAILADPGTVLSGLPYFSFKGHFDPARAASPVFLTDGTPILLSRTGYTGEYGFEIFVELKHTLKVWELILAASGEDVGPCGLAARDSLRAGAILPLSHQDIGPWPFINNPWLFALPFDKDGCGFTKNFIGDVVLGLKEQADHTLPFAGYDPRKVALHDPEFGPARVLDLDGREIGQVLTCVADMAVGRLDGRIVGLASPDRPADWKPKGLCCGFVKVRSKLTAGERVVLKDKRRQIEVEIVTDVRPDRTARRTQGRLK